MDLKEFRSKLEAWLDERADELAPPYEGSGTLDQQVAQISKVRRLAYDAGWMRWGWPERVGGLGGSSLLRACFGEALNQRDLVEAGFAAFHEVLAPTIIDYARPELAAEMVPRLLSGQEHWCQGFSEPSTGSNLAALTCRAVRTHDGWRVTGQKVWTSLAQYSHRCVLLTRTGTVESAHKGITALFADMDAPGITIRPIGSLHGTAEFTEVFFDDVLVPFDRTLGEEGQGWAVAMDLLPYERSTALWYRAAHLHLRLQEAAESAQPGTIDPSRLGEAIQTLYAFRARSRATQHRFDAGEKLGPETSIDKVLVATSEQVVLDVAADALADQFVLGDDPTSGQWRSEFLYSRAATIYGGSAEIQRNIIARRLLDLGNDR